MPFPHPEKADLNGILCAGGEFSVELLVEAYSQGIFPWPQEGSPILWFCPARRGVLDFKDFHCSKSTTKMMKKQLFRITFDQEFDQVIRQCSKVPRKGEAGTWIIPEMFEAYGEMFRQGYAHSVEAWQDDRLVGGMYGVMVSGVFSGESMFFLESGASKACLVEFVKHLESQGHKWMDIQMVTPLLKLFGGKYIPRREFLDRLPRNSVVGSGHEN